MRGGNQPVVVPAEVKNQHRPPAANFHGVRVRITPPHVHQIAPHRGLDRLVPNVQVAGRRGMRPARRHEKRFFDNPHADNLYSRAGLVKCDSCHQNESRTMRS